MLTSLHIENIAVIKQTDLDLSDGFTVLTGETGAGKSIIVDSINIILGNKVNKDIIRSGESFALVEAIFSDLTKQNIDALTELGYPSDEDGCILLSRSVSADGKSKVKVNGKACTVSILKDIAANLVNIHGQHDNQSLLQQSNYITYLDEYANLDSDLSFYRIQYEKVKGIVSEISSLSIDEMEKNRLVEMLGFRIKEIESAKLRCGEEDELILKRNKLKNIEKISKSVNFSYRALYSNDKGVAACQLIDKSVEALEKISDVLEGVPEYIERLREARYEIEDIAISVSDSISADSGDPEALLDQIESRLDLIHRLQRKYGADIDSIIEFKNKSQAELENIVSAEDRIIELKSELDKELSILKKYADEIYRKRTLSASALEKSIMNELAFLDMEKVMFSVDISHRDGLSIDDFNIRGLDDVDFCISTNPGEPLKPLASIASGGELSRITLALKSVMNLKENTQTLIFDEVDTGISGSTSQKTGIKLKHISENAQVICVTHSAQISALADNHIFVSKREENGRVQTTVKNLSDSERIYEIARIMGGSQITETLLDSAKELLEISKGL